MDREGFKAHIAKNYSDVLTPLESGKYDPWYEVKADKLVEVCRRLRDDEVLQLDYMANLGGIDTGERFEVEYNLASTKNKARVDLKVALDRENPEVDSIQDIWPAANWYEREMWELYGINIRNHDNLTRFLLPDDWDQGFPMRKDWDAPDFIRMPEY